MELWTFLTQSADLTQAGCVDEFATEWATSQVEAKTQIVRQDDPHANEIIVLDGQLVSTICDPEGKEICVGFYAGPSVVTPNIARARAGQSLVSTIATTDAQIAQMSSDRLTDLMASSEPVRNWTNGVLRKALSQKAGREWCLAALGGSDRLSWFRATYPDYEDIFGHALIASFLGVTPVTFSRLRNN